MYKKFCRFLSEERGYIKIIHIKWLAQYLAQHKVYTKCLYLFGFILVISGTREGRGPPHIPESLFITPRTAYSQVPECSQNLSSSSSPPFNVLPVFSSSSSVLCYPIPFSFSSLIFLFFCQPLVNSFPYLLSCLQVSTQNKLIGSQRKPSKSTNIYHHFK